MNEKYNGWKNYETWVTKLWLDNEKGTVEIVKSFFEISKDKTEFEDMLKNYIDSFNPLTTGLYADLLGGAISEIDFREIAEAYIDEFSEGEEE